jgi:uncharacterized membrane protein YedE/YeeE
MYNFDTPLMIVYGILTGLVFGFLLHKAGVTRYQTILGQFLFKDYTVLKVMLTAIVTGAVGIYGMRAIGLEFPMHIKAATLVPNIVGGLIFGVGMALLGFCPGTGVAAIGDGSRHAIAGLLGMFVGGAIYAYVYPSIMDSFLKSGDLTATIGEKSTDKVTFADVSHLSPWWFILGLVIISAVVFALIQRYETKSKKPVSTT